MSMITSVQALGLLVITQQVKTYSVYDYLSASFGFATITQQVALKPSPVNQTMHIYGQALNEVT